MIFKSDTVGELQSAVDTFPVWKAFLWCFYPITALVIFELLSRGFDDDDAAVLPDEEESMPLANQNFPDIEGKVENIAENLEYCAKCSKPVKEEWKACPYCGEFLEVYEEG